MPRKSAATVRPVLEHVLPMDEIKRLSLHEACARFAERATVSQRAFAEMGKLHHAISAVLKTGQTIYGELRKLGVKDSTISNASYASRVLADIIIPGVLTEADYDGFTFADCLAICRASGGKSKRRLSREEVAVIVRAKPDTFDLELNSIFETGQTVEEAEAQAKAEAERQAAAHAAELQRQAEEAARRKLEEEQRAAAAQSPAAAPAPAGAPVASTPAIAAAAVPAAIVTPPTTPIAQSAPSTESMESTQSTASTAEPSNITPLPQNPDAALAEVLAGIDEIALTAGGFTPEAKLQVLERLNAAMEFLGENFAPAAVAA